MPFWTVAVMTGAGVEEVDEVVVVVLPDVLVTVV
jgi:hypothetical protein